MSVKAPRRMSLSIMALCAFSQGANAATISITKEVFTGNAPLADTPSPTLQSGNLLQRMRGSRHHFAISPYSLNTGLGPDGKAAAKNAPYSVLNAGGGRLSSATYNVNRSGFTLLWGTPGAGNQIAFYTGENGTGSLINVIGGETTFYNGANLPCYISGCRGRFDLVTFTVSEGNIGSVVLSDRGGGSFEYNILSPAAVAKRWSRSRSSAIRSYKLFTVASPAAAFGAQTASSSAAGRSGWSATWLPAHTTTGSNYRHTLVAPLGS